MKSRAANGMAENSSLGIADVVSKPGIPLRLATTIVEQTVQYPLSRPLRIAGHQGAKCFMRPFLGDAMGWDMLVEDVLEQTFLVLSDTEANLSNSEARADVISSVQLGGFRRVRLGAHGYELCVGIGL